MLWIGTSGFSYDDWIGRFYPPGLNKRKWFDFYSKHFNCVEINSTYYSWMSAKAAESLADRAPKNFVFSIKLHGSLTHERKDLSRGAMATVEQNKPFVERGNLAVHLGQFPNSFRPNDDSWNYVAQLAQVVRPLCVEFRNSSWQNDATLQRLAALGVSLCCVDEPRLRGLARWAPVVTANPAYIRFHGRNAAMWYHHKEAWERYNYLYTEEELRQILPDVQKLASATKDAMIFFNNHYAAQAVTNARQLALLLGVPATGQQELTVYPTTGKRIELPVPSNTRRTKGQKET